MSIGYMGRVVGSASAILLGTTMLSGEALAQDAQAVDPATASAGPAWETDAIVVTARRREENLQSVPLSVTAIDNQVLEDFQVNEFQDIENLEPSFSVSASSGRANAPVYSLRGIRPTESIYGQDPTVAVYLADFVQSPAQGSNLGFYDLENVQILKGPQGTLFGRNTVGGAVLLTPRKPSGELAVNGMVGVGNYGLFETELGIDIPVGDTFNVRLAGRTVDGGDYQTNVVNGDEVGGENTRQFRATLVGDLSPDVTNTLMISYDDKDTNGLGQVLQALNPTRVRASFLPALQAALRRANRRDINDIESDLDLRDDVEAWSIANTFEAQLSDDLDFKFIGGYREVDTDTVTDLDASSVPRALTSFQTASLDYGSLEVQLLGNAFDDRLEWVVGGYYYSEKGIENSPGDFYNARIVQSGEIENESYSVFAQGSFDLTDRLTLTAGGRMTWDKRALTISQTFNGACILQVPDPDQGSFDAGQCEVALKDDFSQPTASVSLDYQVTPDVLLYAASRLGYRSGGFNLRASQPAQYDPFDPETVLDFELGTKADWWIGGVQMRTNLAAFYQTYDDIQRTVAVPTAGGTPASAVVNAASANVFGIELQQTIKPTDRLTLSLSYAYNEPEYEEFVDTVIDPVTTMPTEIDISDTPFYFTPTHSGNILLSYEQPLAGDLGALRFGVNAAYTDDTFISALLTSAVIADHPQSVRPLLKQESYWLIDANIGWENIAGSPADLTLYVKNLTDKEYKIGGVQLYQGATGFISSAYGKPRTYGAQLRFQF